MSALDATRGIAMLLVCTAHFIDVYYGTGPRDNWLLNDLSIVSKIATPSFVLVSGCTAPLNCGRVVSYF